MHMMATSMWQCGNTHDVCACFAVGFEYSCILRQTRSLHLHRQC